MKRAAATALVSPHRCKRAPEGVCINDQTLEGECRSALASMRKKCGTLTGKDPVPPMTTRCIYSLWCRVPPGDRIQLRAIGYQTT
jgi:hypothetical protein